MDLDKICYKNTPIKRVIFRLDFLQDVPELNTTLPEPIIDLIKKSFPIVEPKDVVARELRISKADVKDENVNLKEWHFHTMERNASLFIKSNSFAIQVNNYISFQSIFAVLIEIKDVFFTHFSSLLCRRMGLRYINEINIYGETNPLEWDEYINKDLTSIFRVTENSQNIIRAFHNLELKQDDIILKFQYGINNADYPAVIKKKMFTLDLDASYTGILKQHEIDDYLKKQHSVIQNQFEFSITEKLREKFELNLS
ncbi:MAG: TIGR04255 family protein [Bacteroidota bacterium]